MQVLPAERAQRVLAVAGSKVPEVDAPSALGRELPHDVGESHAIDGGIAGGGTGIRIPAEQSQRLEMDAAHGRQTLEAEVEDSSKLVEVDPTHDGGHQHDAQAGLGAVLHRTLF